MSKLLEIYKCDICGNIVEIVNEGKGELVCCGENMKLLKEKTEEEFSDKHKPVIVIQDKNVTIRVGEIPHPTTEEHHILFIEAISPDKKYIKRKYLKAGDVPDMSFICDSIEMKARALCNIHGLWKNE